MPNLNEKEMTFWDHLDELRKIIFRTGFVIILFAVIAFLSKEWLFNIIFAPHRSDFITYRLFCRLGEMLQLPSLCPDSFEVELINTQLASQFLAHIGVSLYAGILVGSPFMIYQFFLFIKPALYSHERKYSGRVIVFAFILFFSGVLLSYFLIFPLSFRFLGTYQVSEFVVNKITLSSYISTMTTLTLLLGLVFEIPLLAYFFAKIGMLNSSLLKKFRRHAAIVMLILAAIITPTADAVTLLLVAVPMYLLYELSIFIVKKNASATPKSED